MERRIAYRQMSAGQARIPGCSNGERVIAGHDGRPQKHESAIAPGAKTLVHRTVELYDRTRYGSSPCRYNAPRYRGLSRPRAGAAHRND